MGKPSAGLLDGAITMFGNYRQCMSIRAYEDDEELDDFFDTDEPKKPVEKKEFFRSVGERFPHSLINPENIISLSILTLIVTLFSSSLHS